MAYTDSHSPRSALLLFSGLVITAAGAACLEPHAGSRNGGDALVDGGDGVDATDTTPDSTPTDTATATDTAHDTAPSDACDVGPTVEQRGVVTFDDPEMAITSVPLDGATLFGIRRTPSDVTPGVYRIVAVDLRTGKEAVVTEDPARLSLIDAREGTLLFERIDYTPMSMRTALFYREADTGKEVELSGASGGDTGLIPGPYGLDTRVRVVERGAAVWGEQSFAAGGPAVARIRRFAGGAIETLWEERTGVSPPHLRGGRVLWSSYGERAALWLAEPGEAVQPIAKGILGDYALTADAAWWIEAGAVMRRDLQTGENQRVHEGPCALLTSDATRAAAVCGRDVQNAAFPNAVAGRPVVFDRLQRTDFATRGGDLITGLRLEGGRLAWVEYPADVGCGTDIFTTGELVLASLDAPESPQRFDVVTSGCWCCGAYWPPLELALSEEAMAWNYPVGEDIDPGTDRGASVGWALFASGGCR